MSTTPEDLDRIAKRLEELATELNSAESGDERAAELAREAAELSADAAGNITAAVREVTGSGESRRLD